MTVSGDALAPLVLQDPTKFARTRLLAKRRDDGLPPHLSVGRELSKGSNSSVRRAAHLPPALRAPGRGEGATAAAERARAARRLADDEGAYIVRRPLRDSDTLKKSHAIFEFEVSAIAARLGVAPALYDAWYVEHSTKEQRRGLHLVLARYEMDMHDLAASRGAEVLRYAEPIGAQIDAHLRALSREGIFLYDLKPANVVLNLEPVEVRLIDFGREFCERRGGNNSPVLVELEKTVRRVAAVEKDAVADVMHASMLVMLSAIVAHNLQSQRYQLKTVDRATRLRMNPLAARARALRRTTRAPIVRAVKETLRNEHVRAILRHYLGGRHSCVKRVFGLAGFVRGG